MTQHPQTRRENALSFEEIQRIVERAEDWEEKQISYFLDWIVCYYGAKGSITRLYVTGKGLGSFWPFKKRAIIEVESSSGLIGKLEEEEGYRMYKLMQEKYDLAYRNQRTLEAKKSAQKRKEQEKILEELRREIR